jgi:hypothetical protein
VGADAAVAVTVQGRRVAATPTIALAGDQIDERFILDLLHESLAAAGRGSGGDRTVHRRVKRFRG